MGNTWRIINLVATDLSDAKLRSRVPLDATDSGGALDDPGTLTVYNKEKYSGTLEIDTTGVLNLNNSKSKYIFDPIIAIFNPKGVTIEWHERNLVRIINIS